MSDLDQLTRYEVCTSLPRMPEKEIIRENLMLTVDTLIQSGIQLIGVEGQEGIGKTTLLAQLARKNPDLCISLFVGSTSRLAIDPGFVILDLCNQAHWILYGREIEDARAVDESLLRTLYFDLQRRARRKNSRYFFILDGAEDFPGDSDSIQKSIVDMLPLGLPQFCVLLSSGLSGVPKFLQLRVRYKPLLIPAFTLDETASYLADLSLPREHVHEIHKVCKGVPGNLAAVRRLISSGKTPRELIDELPSTMPELFDIEWRAVHEDNPEQVEVLSLLAHDRRKHSVSSLSQSLGMSLAQVREDLAGVNFLVVPTDDASEIAFVSDSFQRFASTRLHRWRERVRTKLIDSFLSQPQSEDALVYLPRYLEEAGRFTDLLEFLSPEHFSTIVERNQSLLPVKQEMELGLKAALHLDRDQDLLRFGIQSSLMAELDGCEVARAEVEARMALDDYKSAMALAQGAILKRDRLRLLATIARLQREQGLTPEPELSQQIAQLSEEVDFSGLGEKLVELASDLLFVRPDLAIQLVEKHFQPTSEEHTVDWAFAQLSVTAALARRQELSGIGTASEDIRLKIKDPKAQQFSAAVSFLLSNYTAEDVLREIDKLEKPKARLFILREWAMGARGKKGIEKVLEYAMSLAIRTTEYTPLASHLRELATPLPFVTDREALRRLVSTFDTQKATVVKLGPTEEYVRLQLVLAHAESKYDGQAASGRLLELFYDVEQVEDLEVKTACLARMAAAIPRIDPESKLTDSHDILATTSEDLEQNLERLLAETADHYLVTRNILAALSRSRPEIALLLIKKLNIEPRRDEALMDFVKHSLKQDLAAISTRSLQEALGRFADAGKREDAIRLILDRIEEFNAQELSDNLPRVLPFFNMTKDIRDIGDRCRACCDSIIALVKSGKQDYQGLQDTLTKRLESSWQSMDMGWSKIDTGFQLASRLAKHKRELAARLLTHAEALQRQFAVDYAVFSFSACVRLSIRAYSGLLPKHFDSEDDLSELITQIRRVGSSQTKILLLTDLALRAFRFERDSVGRQIVFEHIKPLLENVRGSNSHQWSGMLTISAPALYRAHPQTALELFELTEQPFKEKALLRVIEFIFTNVPSGDPYDSPAGLGRYRLTYERAFEVYKLLPRLDSDSDLYHGLSRIIESSIWKQNKDEFTKQKKADLAQRLSVIVQNQMPNPRFIQHQGFQLISEAQMARLAKQKPGVWADLVKRGWAIPNLADRAYVLGILAQICSDDSEIDRSKLLRDAKALVDKIPSVLDRVDHLESLADHSADADPFFSKQCITEAASTLKRTKGPETGSIQRRIVDFAYRLDPELASSIASSFDDDEARIAAKQRIQFNEMMTKMGQGQDIGDQVARQVAKAAWKLLGKLNADRVEPVHIGDTRRFVQIAANAPLSEAFPILSWVIENTIRRRAHADQSVRLLHGIFDASILGCELCFRMSGSRPARLKVIPLDSKRTPVEGGLLVRSGERQEALDYLREWLMGSASEYLKICDHYFGPEDLEVLQLVLGSSPKIKVCVLTSKKHNDKCAGRSLIEDVYRQHWRRISDQRPPGHRDRNRRETILR